jgi:hypothetical protein
MNKIRQKRIPHGENWYTYKGLGAGKTLSEEEQKL